MRLTLILFLSLLVGLAFAKDENTRYLSLESEGIEQLVIECGAGFLKVTGKEGLDKIQVQAEIKSDGLSTKKLQKGLTLTLDSDGNTAKLVSKFDNSGFMDWLFQSGEVQINLTITVPRKMNLDIYDGSGFIKIKNIDGNTEVKDGSGELTMKSVKGKVVITDGSGEIFLNNISGDCRLIDGSGGITIEEIKGQTSITDGSGDLEIRRAEGDIDIVDGSGDISIEHVVGNITLSDGSGDINVNEVEGDLVITFAGSGGVYTNNISGKIVNKNKD